MMPAQEVLRAIAIFVTSLAALKGKAGNTLRKTWAQSAFIAPCSAHDKICSWCTLLFSMHLENLRNMRWLFLAIIRKGCPVAPADYCIAWHMPRPSKLRLCREASLMSRWSCSAKIVLHSRCTPMDMKDNRSSSWRHCTNPASTSSMAAAAIPAASLLYVAANRPGFPRRRIRHLHKPLNWWTTISNCRLLFFTFLKQHGRSAAILKHNIGLIKAYSDFASTLKAGLIWPGEDSVDCMWASIPLLCDCICMALPVDAGRVCQLVTPSLQGRQLQHFSHWWLHSTQQCIRDKSVLASLETNSHWEHLPMPAQHTDCAIPCTAHY